MFELRADYTQIKCYVGQHTSLSVKMGNEISMSKDVGINVFVESAL